jgi:hypothetical protein
MQTLLILQIFFKINGAVMKEFLKPDVPISISYQKLLEVYEEICEKFVSPSS